MPHIDPTSPFSQVTDLFTLQSAAAADGNGTTAPTDGFNGAQMVEIAKTGTGTTTATIEGSFDGATWYAVGYQRVDAQASLARAASGISVTAGTFARVYQILDLYPQIRLRLSSTSGVIVLTAKLYAVVH